MNQSFYLTTTLPYINAKPHLGFALEAVQADAIVRYKKKFKNKETFFNTGMDEHGLKVYRKAQEEGLTPKEYVDKSVVLWKEMFNKLNIEYDNFIRTTDEYHKKSAQEFWRKCEENGDIYKGKYEVKYCVGCELEVTDSELDKNGKCPLHPNLEVELIEEENYFFRFSKYADKLLDLYESKPGFVKPESKMKEIKSFVNKGLRDFSVSRIKEKMPWGIEVPGDSEQVMYVWFDALVNYVSAIGWPYDMDKFNNLWPALQLAGKDNLRQQSAMWQAMLLSAGIKPSEKILIHGFITSNGKKMSKSLGNVIDPLSIQEEYGTDPLRYYLLFGISTFEDGDFTEERFLDFYNADLANGIGNLTSRILKMSSNYGVAMKEDDLIDEDEVLKNNPDFEQNMENFELSKAGDYLREKTKKMDVFIEENKPFKVIKTNEQKAKSDILYLLSELYEVSVLLNPFVPQTSDKIKNMIKGVKLENLFKRR